MSAVNCISLTVLADSWPWPTCQYIGKHVEPCRDVRMCGKPSINGSSYCAEHYPRIWSKRVPTGQMNREGFRW